MNGEWDWGFNWLGSIQKSIGEVTSLLAVFQLLSRGQVVDEFEVSITRKIEY